MFYKMNDSNLLTLMQDRLLDSAKDTLLQLIDCWHELYDLDEEKIKTLIDRFFCHTTDLFKEMLNSQMDKINKLRDDINNLIEEKTTLEKDLNVNILITEDSTTFKPLTNQKEYLEKLLLEYIELRNTRVSEMKQLMSEMDIVCGKMEKEVPNLIDKAVPDEHDLIVLRSEVMNLREEKNSRIDILAKLRNRMVSITCELEISHDCIEDWSPELKYIFLNQEEEWPLSTNYIQLMQEHLLEMQIKLDEAKKKKEKLITELRLVWNKIREDAEYQNDFIAHNNYYGKHSLRKISEEIDRCLIIRKQKLKPLTDDARAEITVLWDKLTLINKDREQFKEFYIDMYSEDLLENHEKYLFQLKAYYEKYRDFYLLMSERNKLWSSWVELETRALDKNRFNNRGGQLLKEEKERKVLIRKIPKIESDILAKIKVHLDTEGKPLLWNGQEPQKIIDCDHQKLEILKEQQKTMKKEDQQKCPGSAKRKLPHTPDSKLKKILKKTVTLSQPQRVLNQTVTLSGGGYSHVFSSPVGPTPTPRHGLKDQSCENLNSMASYSEFQAKLVPDTPRRPFEEVNLINGPLCSSPVNVHIQSPSKTMLKTTPKPWSKPTTPKTFTFSPRTK